MFFNWSDFELVELEDLVTKTEFAIFILMVY